NRTQPTVTGISNEKGDRRAQLNNRNHQPTITTTTVERGKAREKMDMLAQHGSKSGWLHRKKKAHLLGGTAWKKGYWVLNGKTKTLREFSSQVDPTTERGALSSYEPRNIAKAGKDGDNLMV